MYFVSDNAYTYIQSTRSTIMRANFKLHLICILVDSKANKFFLNSHLI